LVGWTGFSKTLRGRLGIFFIIVAVIPLLVLSLIGLNQFSSTITDEIEANYETQSREKLNTLEMLISEGRTTISTVAGTPSLRNLAENSATQAESMGLTTMSVEEREAFTGDNSWTVAGASGVAAFLQERVEASGGMFAELFMTDKYGHTVAASKNTSDFVQSDEEWWQEVLERDSISGI
jgi:nitrogen fixation/metabolism regulation signal transduction histidine kinase